VARFELTRAALADVEAVAEYTLKHWGQAQAAAYVAGLEALFVELAQRPLSGRKREDLAPWLLSFPFESHVVYYSRAPSGITVIRILHYRLDAPRHLR